MRVFTIGATALATLSVLCPLALTQSVDSEAGELSQYTKRELEARDRLFATLSDEVREDLLRRHSSEYDLNLEMFMERDEQDGEDWEKRDDPQGPGSKHCKNGNVAMTYDDGPYTYTKKLADLWADSNNRITYFINVNNWQCAYNSPNPENLQYALKKGHSIASHTATHPHLPKLTIEQIDKQVQLVEEFTYKTLGLIPAFIRPPYGESNAEIQAHLKKKWGLSSVMWSLDAGDAMGLSPDESVARIKQQVRKGSTDIILNHEVKELSVSQVAPRVISYFKKKNIKSSGVGKCLGKKAYKVKLNTVPKRDASWNCNNVPAPGQT